LQEICQSFWRRIRLCLAKARGRDSLAPRVARIVRIPGHFAGLGVGHVPRFLTVVGVGAARNAPQVRGGNYRRIMESGELAEGERLAPVLQLGS